MTHAPSPNHRHGLSRLSARTQSALRLNLLYPDAHTSPSYRALHSKGPSAVSSISRPSPATHSAANLRFAPYSLTPSLSGPQRQFSAATTGKLRKAIDNGLAIRTQKNYGTFIEQFRSFCRDKRVAESDTFPASELVLCAFIGSLTGEKSGSSASAAVAALKAWHACMGLSGTGATSYRMS
ncbi:DNA breaking-rejoining enzyme [Rhizoctonia solani]|uniref:DNA breaking-rejoining enzyme n=1 Tax=Rhizoctonia solani TaxID=456999 RepID=A0A8H7M508_9AGAM|nr:DNA breaking-rejoining enzyme [Rhizoctonia solani]